MLQGSELILEEKLFLRDYELILKEESS